MTIRATRPLADMAADPTEAATIEEIVGGDRRSGGPHLAHAGEALRRRED